MSNMIQAARQQVAQLTQAAYEKAAQAGVLPAGVEVNATIQIPKDTAHGDYATSFAMAGAKAMHMAPRAIAQAIVDHLELEGYLRVDGTHDTLEVTGKARGILFQGETVSLPIRADRQPERSRRRKAAAIPPAEDRLYDALRSERMRIAQAEGVPAYVVFSNAALADMAARRPRSLAEFLEVSGVGEVKARKYGKAFLRTLAQVQED